MVHGPAEPRCGAVGGRLRGGHGSRALDTEPSSRGKRYRSALEKLDQLAGRGRSKQEGATVS